MLDYNVAQKYFENMRRRLKEENDEDLDELFQDLLKTSVSYAHTRASWFLLSIKEKAQDDASRTIRHDAVIGMLTCVCRNLGINDLEIVMPDRKTKGDFACYIALFLALEQR